MALLLFTLGWNTSVASQYIEAGLYALHACEGFATVCKGRLCRIRINDAVRSVSDYLLMPALCILD